ncbi:MAG: hypothetical protein IJZ20_01825, partial [Clostridia bacterium]|nr:hypothetical protein [Clostridia bacterium]
MKYEWVLASASPRRKELLKMVIDDYTIRFNLNMPMPDFPSYLDVKIYSKTAFEEMDPKEASAIGTGPYYYDTEMTQSGVQFVGTRYDNYWEGIEKHPTEHIV